MSGTVLRGVMVCMLWTALPAMADEHEVVFPPDAGVVNVRDHGAAGDGRTDDTKALRSAMEAAVGGVLYLPNGVYLVSDRLDWPDDARHAALVLQGQSASGVVIQLADELMGFQDPEAPRAVVRTNEMGSADNFRNHIRNLTIDTGRSNPGAIALQYMSNNIGAVFDVTLRSGDGGGLIGLDMGYNALNGPLLIKRVTVEGFDVGIACRGSVNSQTLEHVTLAGQKVAGLVNRGQVLSVRGLRSRNSVPAVLNLGAGVLTLMQSELTEGASDRPAIDNQGVLFAREVRVEGYGVAIDNASGDDVPTGTVSEHASGPTHTLFGGPARPLNLPIEETPRLPWETDFSRWANVRSFGASPEREDNREPIQAAIDSGATTLYFPRGDYKVSGTIELRGQVRHIVGLQSMIRFGAQEQTVFRLGDAPGSPDTLVIDQLNFAPWNRTNPIDNASTSRTLVLRSLVGAGSTHTGSGRLFIEDCGTGVQRGLHLLGPTRAWVRQLSNEPRERQTHLTNRGGTIWILGHKTEMPGVLIHTSDGGRTEICGAFVYSGVGGDMPPEPMYVVEDASFSVTMGGVHYAGKRKPYDVLVRETRNGVTKELLATDAAPRERFRSMALFSGGASD